MEVGYERFAAAYPCPLRRDGQLLCDGAYADIAPIDVARSFGHPAVVAVDAGQALVSEIRNGYQALTPAVEIRRHGEFDTCPSLTAKRGVGAVRGAYGSIPRCVLSGGRYESPGYSAR